MDLINPGASMFIPDAIPVPGAFKRTTHMGIGAHQDDLEIMAFHGIRTCFEDPVHWFGGVVCTSGTGSARTGKYAQYSDDEMRLVRRIEQDKAASIGKYSFIAQLDYPSSVIKRPGRGQLETELTALLEAAKPRVLYTHNPADKHETHIGTVAAVIDAVRALAPEDRPETVYGCEVWRDLDWMLDEDKIVLDVNDKEHLSEKLIAVFDSQIEGGKRYDLATLGRRYAHATYFQSHQTDQFTQVMFAMDLSPLFADDTLDIMDYVMTYVNRFQNDVKTKLGQRLGNKNKRK